MKPIETKTWKYQQSVEVDKEWTYEEIMDTWSNDPYELVPMLAKRCKELEERIEAVYALVVTSYSDDVNLGEVRDTLYGEEGWNTENL